MRLLLPLLLCVSIPAFAQRDGEETSAPPSPCSSQEFHQLDFWIGDWIVTADGQTAGTSSIHPIHNGCVLLEQWQGAGPAGISGSGFYVYDRPYNHWHQTWVDANGTLLELDGEWGHGSMVLQGERPRADDPGMVIHRISVTPIDDGSVRQLWEASQDGHIWTVLFDGLYERDSTTK